MSSCAAFGCTNRPSYKRTGITFHRFPSEPRLRKLWIAAVKRKNWEPSIYSRLCSAHFTEDQIDRTSLCCVRIRPDAVPSVFNFPPYIKKILREKKKIERTYKNQSDNFSDEDSASDNQKEYPSPLKKQRVSEEQDSDTEGDVANLSNFIKANKESIAAKNGKCSNPNKSLTVKLIKTKAHKSLNSDDSITDCPTTNSPIISTLTPVSSTNNYQFVPPSLLNELSSSLVIKRTFDTCDASTSPDREIIGEEELKEKLEKKERQMDNYRKKIKSLHQQNRRYKTRLINLKHSIFAELQKRQYLSSDSDFRLGHEGCLVDRKSVRPCLSSESEDLDEDV